MGHPRGDRRLSASFGHAFAGIVHAVRSQRNLRIHLAISAGVIALGLWLGLSCIEWAVLVATMALVLLAEMFNTVAETTVDLATQEYHDLARAAKDVAAGAVLVGAILAVIIGLLILGPPLWERLSSWF
jgi:undecaprenol kinase